MISDLDQLIKAFESERRFLEKAIKDSLAENDFLIAHYHFEALSEVNSRLSVLKSFKDPLHNEKDLVTRMEKRLSKSHLYKQPHFKKLNKESREILINSFKANIEEKQKNIDALAKSRFDIFYDTQEIDEALFNLYNRIYRGFTLSINQHSELVLKFEHVDGQLIISTKHDIQFYEPDFILDNRFSNHLSGLGFKFDIEQQQYSYSYSFLNFKDATPVKILLSRIVFDLYKLSDINQISTLVYYN